MVSSWMSGAGREFGLGVSGTLVAISIEADLLNREAKLERLDLELSVRIGGFLADGGVAGDWCSADAADEEREVSSGDSCGSCDLLFLCFSEAMLARREIGLCDESRTEIPESKHVEFS